MEIKIMLAQPHVIPANIETNLKTVLALSEQALKENANMVIFPLDAMTGSNLGTLSTQMDFRRDAANARLAAEKIFQRKLQIVYSDDYNLCGFSLRPKFIGISPIFKNILIHGGGSAAYDAKGNLAARAKFFQEELFTVYFDSQRLTLDGKSETTFATETEAIFCSIIYGIREFFNINHITDVTIGLSGGIDSAVATALYVIALGPDKVHTVSMPSQFNSELTQKLADNIAKNLNTHHLTIPITDGVQQIVNILKANNLPVTTLGLENIQARERGARILAAIAAANNSVISANSNKAELTVGYSTFYGDLAGAIAPLGDLWKHQIYDLGRYMNEKIFKKSVLPEAVFQIRPSAELNENQTIGKGGDPIYYPYHDYLFNAFVKGNSLTKIAKWYQNGTLEENIGCQKNMTRIVFKNDNEQFFKDLELWYNAYHGLSVAKRIQAPPVIVVSDNPFGSPEPQLMPYYPKEYLGIKEAMLH